jgi:hypothetical protein
MEPGDGPGSDNLDRLRDLLAGLGGALVNGDLLGWAGAGDLEAVPDEVFGVVRDAGLLEDSDPRHPVIIPADAEALMSRMWEVDEPAAVELLSSLAGSGPHNGQRRHRLRRRYPNDPVGIFQELAGLIGPGTRWWTNTDLTRWNPITQHNFDAIVVGAANGIIVTVIAFEGG